MCNSYFYTILLDRKKKLTVFSQKQKTQFINRNRKGNFRAPKIKQEIDNSGKSKKKKLKLHICQQTAILE